MDYETIITDERDSIFIITFNRLEAKNAINNQMQEDLSNALDYWDKNDALRVCVLTNKGDVFCAGSDLKEIANGTHRMPEGKEKWGFAGMTKRYFDKPIISAVHGKALGGGVEIVVSSDLCVAATNSIFGLPEPRVGLTAAGGGTLLRLAQQIPTKLANELLLVAEPISAEKALEWGLINYAVPDDEVLDKAIELAQKISLGAPLSIKYSKRTAYETMSESCLYPSHGWDVVEKYEKITRGSEDAHEGSSAFAEKRKPIWKGR